MIKSIVKYSLPIFILYSVVFLLFFVIYNNIIMNSVYKNYKNTLKNEALLVENALKNANNQKGFDKLTYIAKKTNLYIVIVTKKGDVIYSSHNNYNTGIIFDKEIRDAIYNNTGYSIRYSRTLSKKMIYYATQWKNNYILRIGYPVSAIGINGWSEKNTLFMIGFFMVIIVITLIYIIRVTFLPVQKLNYIVDAINTNKNIHFPHFKSPNMSKIAKLIYKIYNAMIEKQKMIEEDKDKLTNIILSIDDGILILDSKNNVILTNPKFMQYIEANIRIKENVLSNIDNIETMQLLTKLTKLQHRNEIIEFKKRYFKILINTIKNYKLIIIRNITEKHKYGDFKARLTDSISHELKTPLATLMGYSETILNHDLDNKTKQKFIEKIYQTTERLNELINDMLEINKLEFQKNGFKVENPIRLKEIENIIQSTYAFHTKKTLHLMFEDREIFILKEHIMSILNNLISNAIKYSTGNNIFVHVYTKDKNLIMDVDDEGPIIPDDEISSIFERFYTISSSRNREKSGTGLGLSIVKHISQLYQGQIIIEKNQYSGNRFKIILNQKN